MRRSDLRKMHCLIARSRARVGAWWSILTLRDALHGDRRFDAFQQGLGIATERIHRRHARRKVEAGAA